MHDVFYTTGRMTNRSEAAFVEAVPKIVKEGLPIEEAEALKAKIEEQGAVVTLK